MEVRVRIAEILAAGLGGTNPDHAAIGAQLAELGNAENECWGIEHGYRYESSPVICHDQGAPPPFDPLVATPTTWPGARLPHVFLADGSALYDHLGADFTLLAIGGADCAGFADAAARARIPLRIVPLPNERSLDLLERRLLLVRPDHHVAWRGNDAPGACREVLERVTGRGAPRAEA
jgi:hypothetical protein